MSKGFKLIEIIWADATCNGGWYDPEDGKELNNPMQVLSIGFVIDENKNSIMISSNLSQDDSYLNYTVIPKPWILRRKWVK